MKRREFCKFLALPFLAPVLAPLLKLVKPSPVDDYEKHVAVHKKGRFFVEQLEKDFNRSLDEMQRQLNKDLFGDGFNPKT